jgi:hypothetical protein
LDPRAGLDDVEKIKFLNLPGFELRLLSRPACSQSLHRLDDCGSLFLVGRSSVGGQVQLDPLGIAATIRASVPAPGDYDDGKIVGIMIGRGNRSTCPNTALSTTTPAPHILLGREPWPSLLEGSD